MQRPVLARRSRPHLSCLLVALLAACGGADPTGPDGVRPDGPDPEPENPTQPPPTAPALPPVASLVADLAPLLPAPSPGSAASAAGGPAGGSALAADGNHFTTAVVRTGNVRGATADEVAEHRSALRPAAEVTPVWDAGVHIWRYTAVVAGVSRSIVLSARPDGDAVSWEMRGTADGTSRLWMDGTSWNEAAEGTWRAYDPAGEEDGVRTTVDWALPATGTRSVRFQAAGGANEPVGPWMRVAADGTSRRVDGRDGLVVQWDAVAVAGLLQSPTVNGGLRICWDAQRQDVGCS
ncbi:MAG: hypothetical protein RH859_06435 [Longimicrobiales bacterium]